MVSGKATKTVFDSDTGNLATYNAKFIDAIGTEGFGRVTTVGANGNHYMRLVTYNKNREMWKVEYLPAPVGNVTVPGPTKGTTIDLPLEPEPNSGGVIPGLLHRSCAVNAADFCGQAEITTEDTTIQSAFGSSQQWTCMDAGSGVGSRPH